MDWPPSRTAPYADRLQLFWQRGLRLGAWLAIAFGLAAVAAIALGAAVTDNGLVQIIVTIFSALALWLPFTFIVAGADRMLRRRGSRAGATSQMPRTIRPVEDEKWRRLAAAAPGQSQRIAVLRRSLERTRSELGRAELDPEAHDLCILIDRRLPELIEHELEVLPPDDLHRRRKVGELVDLIEQFARHCSRRDSADSSDAAYQAAVLRRRFEARLSDF